LDQRIEGNHAVNAVILNYECPLAPAIGHSQGPSWQPAMICSIAASTAEPLASIEIFWSLRNLISLEPEIKG